MVDDGRTTDGRTTDGRTPDHGHPISSPCEPDGSGELKMGRGVSAESSWAEMVLVRDDPEPTRDATIFEASPSFPV